MIHYTNERNIQILISVLKHNNVRKIIASPGTTHMAFVASLQSDPFFEIYSCVDERSACYMACGLSVESGEPVVITCTGATASRNYLSGLTEAYYSKIPILAVTAARHFSKLGQNIPQSIDRTSQIKDTCKLSVQIPIINSLQDEEGCVTLINEAILELTHRSAGPVHINIVTSGENSKNFTTEVLPKTRFIDRIMLNNEFPKLENKKVAIFVGNHRIWDKKLTLAVDKFCELYDAVVLCDHTSNYHGKYKIIPSIIFEQDKYISSLNNFDVMIHIGNVSGAYLKIKSQEVWRVNLDGKVIDTYSKLRYVFEMEECDFFEKYNSLKNTNSATCNYLLLKKEFDDIEKMAYTCEIPFSNIYVARSLIKKIPDGSFVHLAILNSLRSWNFFTSEKNFYFSSNTGGFGIDGSLSTIIGSSLNSNDKIYFGIVGDLAFFYDINSLGNRHVGNNIRIVLINNGCGTEFHNYIHPASYLGSMENDFIAADGHFGNKSENLVKDYTENLGFQYISAKNKEEFLNYIDYFTSSKMYNKSIVFEIFTNSEDENEALKIIKNLKISNKKLVEDKIKGLLSDNTKKRIKKIIKNK